MKKLGISMVALMIGLPMAARADIANATKVNIATNTNVATTSFVGGAYDALVDEINTNRGQINTNTNAIAGKQAQLKNDAATPADIATTVKTSIATTGASDTALVTESAVRNAITAASYNDTALVGRVTTLEGTVGNNTSGLVKDVADLQTTVGDSTSGLVKAVADNTTAIAGKANSATTLAGYGITDAYTKTETDNAITNGAVQTVAAGTANGTISVDGGADVTVYDDSALAGRVTTVEGKVTTLEGTVGDSTSGLVKDVADNAAAITALQTASSTTKGFAVHGTWGSPTTATGHVNVVDSSTLNP